MRRLGALALLLTLGVGCASLLDDAVVGSISADHAEVRAAHGAAPMPGDPQVLMTRLTRPEAEDRARAEQLLADTRRSILRFRDVHDAEAAGYRSFPPDPPPDLQIVHYVHRAWSRAEADGIDPARPGSLLYERDGQGGLRLLGAMYTAPADAPLDELDARVPLSVTQWHLHQNVCVPRPLWDRDAWAQTYPDGQPVFGPGSPTASEAACDRAGGRFLPTVFGWMAHLNVFADDPADVWNAHYGHDAPGEHGDVGHGTHHGAH